MNLTNLEFSLFYKQSILHIFHSKESNTFNKKQESRNGFIETRNHVYRHVHDSLFYNDSSLTALHSKQIQNSIEKQWNDVAEAYHPNFSNCTKLEANIALNYIKRILKLPHRVWNQVLCEI
jgi:hypothetical protein